MDWDIKVCHSYHEANACADALANMGCNHEAILIFYEHWLLKFNQCNWLICWELLPLD